MANILHFLVTPRNPSDIGCIALRNLDLQSNQLLAAYHYPRVIHTHYKPNMLPDDAFKKGRKVVLVFRNPKTPLSQCSSFLERTRWFRMVLTFLGTLSLTTWWNESSDCLYASIVYLAICLIVNIVDCLLAASERMYLNKKCVTHYER